MDISAIGKSVPFDFIMHGKDSSGNVPPVVQDEVHISMPHILSGQEADEVLDATIDMLARDNVAALSAHGGLSHGRVFGLLGL